VTKKSDTTMLWYKNPARKWTEALPIGNGRIGAMIYGGIENEKIALNEDTLWAGYPKDTTVVGAAKAFENARELALEGKYFEAQEMVEDHFQGAWTESFMPMGDMLLKFDHSGEVSDYYRDLDISIAVAAVRYKCSGTTYTREYLTCAVNDVFVTRITADKPGMVSFRLGMESKLKSTVSAEGCNLILDGECPSDAQPSYVKCENPITYSEKDEERGVCFRTAVKVVAKGGRVESCGNEVVVTGADEAAIYMCVETSFNGYNKLPYLEGREYKDTCLNNVEEVSLKSFETIKNEHIKEYKNYFDRVKLDLGSNDKDEIPTDERLIQFENNKDDLGLYTLLFNFGRYLIISSSREGTQATNLQGIWNDQMRAPWSSNYTVNINTEMNYWPVLMCNLPEFNKPLMELVQGIRENGRKTAQVHYNARGFTSHHNVDIWCQTTPVGSVGRRGSSVFAFWNMSSGWLCRHVFEHYEYTGDVEFLRSQGYPTMKEAAEFYLDLLTRDKDGYLVLCPSTSPENTFYYNGKPCAISVTTTMTMSIIKDLFINCIKASVILGIDDKFRSELEEKLKQLYPFKIGSKGQLIEWYDEYEECEPHHRHVSHLYALHPSDLITVDGTPELSKACKRTLELRGDDGTGWSLGWKINMWARLKEGNHALKLVDRQLRVVDTDGTNYGAGGGTYINMFDAHPPFQIDGNFGATSGIGEMLVQSSDGLIEILPALPDKWANGSVKGLLAKGNIVVDIEWSDCKVKEIVLCSKFERSIKLKYNGKIIDVNLQAGKAERIC
jgi:alpha-L-fucosidase 2